MTQQELEQRLREIASGGDPAKLRYSREVKSRKVPNPKAAPTLPDGSKNPNYVYGSPSEIDEEFTVESWVDTATAATIEAERQSDGTIKITKDSAGTRQPPAQTASQKPEGGSEAIEGTPTGQNDANGNPIYDNERPRKVIRDQSGKEIWSGPLNATEMKEWRQQRERSRNPGSKTDDEIEADAERQRQTARQEEADRLAREREERAGRAEARATEAAATNAQTAAANARRADAQEARAQAAANRITMEDGTVVEKGEDGVWRPIKTEGTGSDPLPASIAPYTPDFDDPAKDLGLGKRRQVLQQAVREGKIKPQQAAAEIAANAEQAKTAAANRGVEVRIQEGNRTADQTERGRQTTEAGNRATLSSNILGNASRNYAAAKILPGDGGAVADAYLAELALGQHFAGGMGALNSPGPMNAAAYPLLYPNGQGAPPAAQGPGAAPAAPVPTLAAPAAPAPAASGVTINVNAGAGGAPAAPAPQPIQNQDGTWSSPAGGVYTPGVPNPPTTGYPGSWFSPTGAQPAASGVVGAPGAMAGMDPRGAVEADGVLEDLAAAGFDVSDLVA